MVGLGIRAFQLETGHLPARLSDLVPKYLSAVPDDPFGSGSLKYGVSGESYVLYSVGPDGDDGRGQSITVTNGKEMGDYTADYLFPLPPPLPPPASGSNSSAPADSGAPAKGDD